MHAAVREVRARRPQGFIRSCASHRLPDNALHTATSGERLSVKRPPDWSNFLVPSQPVQIYVKISPSVSSKLLSRCAVTARATLRHPRIFEHCCFCCIKVHGFLAFRTLSHHLNSQHVT